MDENVAKLNIFLDQIIKFLKEMGNIFFLAIKKRVNDVLNSGIKVEMIHIFSSSDD